ncbi:MAG: hypothetical protein LBR12_04385 [Opitutaceae bacterium]|jgi:hypothetical protein|nr:hypothetical protein [Opitutaceae bacterium]
MNTALVSSLADAADELLAGLTRAEARETLLDHLRENHAALPAAERKRVADAVLLLLDREDFFNAVPGGDPDDNGSDDDAPDADE